MLVGGEEGADGITRPTPGSNYAGQQEVFNDVGMGVLQNAYEGFNTSLFAYGQTGAGKSYSMVGYGANKGIVPMSFAELFARIAKSEGTVLATARPAAARARCFCT